MTMKLYDADSVQILDIAVDDDSFRSRELMGDDVLTLRYSLPEHVDIPVGAWCEWQGMRYTLIRPEGLVMHHTRNYDYTLTLYAPYANAGSYIFRNPIDGRLEFSLTARPREHLQMFVDNMNMRESGWTIGECIDAPETAISYNFTNCLDALKIQSAAFSTEFEIRNREVSLRTVEYNKPDPLSLEYGRGKGFRSGIGRTNYGDIPPVGRLFAQGGERNIDRSKYGSRTLLLPKNQLISFDGAHFSDEQGFNPADSRQYLVDDLGFSIRRNDIPLVSSQEASLDCSEIYPQCEHTIGAVECVDAQKHWYDIMFDDFSIDYSDAVIPGETPTIIFQDRQLAGREFDIETTGEGEDVRIKTEFGTRTIGGVAKTGWWLQIVPATIDSEEMPGGSFIPEVGGKFRLFGISLPDEYVGDSQNKTGAEWEMFRACVRHLYESEDAKYTFTGELDGIWAAKNWLNVGGKIVLGGFVSFRDEHWQDEPVLIRIVGIRDYINRPYSPELQLSNSVVSSGFQTTIQKIASAEVQIRDAKRESIAFTKRRFRDAQETMSMLADAFSGYDPSISPLAVRTMQLIAGDESLQFRFVSSRTNPQTVAHSLTYNAQTNQLTAGAGIIQHLTLGIDSISPTHPASDYRFWTLQQFTSAVLDQPSKRYYLYAKVSRTAQTGQFLLSETAIGMESVSGWLHLLVAMVGSENGGTRSVVTLYGFSEVLPGRILTDRIVSSDGSSFFDMVAAAFKLGDKLSYNENGDGQLIIKGTLVQNEGGITSPIGVFRGVYNPSHVYYPGDTVTYSSGGVVSTYRYIGSNESSGHTPTQTLWWTVEAQGSVGPQGEPGRDGTDGQNGQNGQPGRDGTDGQDGQDGAPGRDGVDGQDGRDGMDAVMYFLVVSPTIIKQGETTGNVTCQVMRTTGTETQPLSGLPASLQVRVSINGGSETQRLYSSITVAVSGVTSSVRFRLCPYSDSSRTLAEVTVPVVADGDATDGVGIENMEIRYAASSSGTTAPTGQNVWKQSIAQTGLTKGQYLWTRTTVTYTDGTTPTVFYSVAYNGTDGQDGSDGQDGAPGSPGNYTEYRYRTSGSKTYVDAPANVPDPSGWSTTQPTVGTDWYLWQTSALKKGSDGSLLGSWSTPVRITPYDGIDGQNGTPGAPGQDGAPGKDGKDGTDGTDGSDGLNVALVELYQSWPETPFSFDVDDAPGAANGFEKLSNGSYRSTNAGDEDSASVSVVTLRLKLPGKVIISGTVSGEKNYDFGLLSYLDSTLSTGNAIDTNAATRLNDTSTNYNAPTPFSYEYANVSAGTHFIYVKYRKDGSGNRGDDCLIFSVSSDIPTVPAKPASAIGYDFTTGAFSGSLGSWSAVRPSLSDDPLWAVSARTASEGLQSTIQPSDWRAPAVVSRTGARGQSAAISFRGEYNPAVLYYGNPKRLDVVKYTTNPGTASSTTAYYIAAIDAEERASTSGGFRNKPPTDGRYWNSFGASFDSVATGLLLAERAYVEGLQVGEVLINRDGETMARMDAKGIEINDGTFRGKVEIGETDGQRVEITKAGGLRTFNSEGDERAVFEGGEYDRSEVIPNGSSDINVPLGASANQTSYVTEISPQDEPRIYEYNLTSVFSTQNATAVELSLSGVQAKATAVNNGASDYDPNLIVGGVSLSIVLQSADNSSMSGASEYAIHNSGSVTAKESAGTDISESAVFSATRRVNLSVGYHRLIVRLTVERYDNGQSPFGFRGTGRWKLNSATIRGDSFMARYFSNGLALTRNADNYFAVVEEEGVMQFSIASDGRRVELTDGSLKIDGAVQPRTVFAAKIVGSTSSVYIDTTYSMMPSSVAVSVVRSGAGRYTLSVPYAFGLTASNCIVRATGVGFVQGSSTAPIKATVVSVSSSSIALALSDDETANDGSCFVEILKY